MNFKEGKPIYLQIADRICDEILAGHYVAEGRIQSVREYSVLLQVNVNTTVRAYDWLSERGIIYNRRGMGYYVSVDAKDIILNQRRKEFIEDILPDLFIRMRQLGITLHDLENEFAKKETESA